MLIPPSRFLSLVCVTFPIPSIYLFQCDGATLKDKNKMQVHLVVKKEVHFVGPKKP